MPPSLPPSYSTIINPNASTVSTYSFSSESSGDSKVATVGTAPPQDHPSPLSQTLPPPISPNTVRLIPIQNPSGALRTYVSLSCVNYVGRDIVLLNISLRTNPGDLRLAAATTIQQVLEQAYTNEFTCLYDDMERLVAIVRPEAVVEVAADKTRGTQLGVRAWTADKTTLVKLPTINIHHVITSLTTTRVGGREP
ncbi:hypothetical protein HDV00_001153 [Rhizophlyctis rosea]|nr:hypothetical protein HDV00_001153 [Rhizophlyctis rosea]